MTRRSLETVAASPTTTIGDYSIIELFTDSRGVELHTGDYVRRLPLGIPGRVLGFDEDTSRVVVEWPHLTDDVSQDDIERLASPVEQLPILEIWQTDEHAPSPNTTWQVLGKWQNIDLEMWTCRIISPDNPVGELGDCYASYIQWDAIQVLA